MVQYKEIRSLEEWNTVLDSSIHRPVVVFKHSTSCPVSSNALKEFSYYLQNDPNPEIDYVLVKVIESRPVSNRIAEDVLLKHESPQIILVKNKEKVWNVSHWAITSEHMTAMLN